MSKRASIDIGSNSILLLIAEYDLKKGLNILFDDSSVTALGKGVDKNQEFQSTSMRDSWVALETYREKVLSFGLKPQDVLVTATEASRVAKNAPEFFNKIEQELGFSVQIISSEEEAYFTALGVIKAAPAKKARLTLMDIGGASTELIQAQCKPFSIKKTISLPVGAVRAHEWIQDGTFEERMKKIFQEFPMSDYKTKNLIGVAGTMTSLAAISLGLKDFDGEKVNQHQISYQDFTFLSDSCLRKEVKELQQEYPFLKKRALVIGSGSLVALKVAQELGVSQFKISTFGLRHGTLIQGYIRE